MNQPDSCQVCHKPFAKGEDVVICPSCGAPYHRECYKKEGQCVYEHKHREGFEYTPAGGAAQPEAASGPQEAGGPAAQAGAQNSAGIVCPNCQTINERPNIFCERCGYPLHSEAVKGQGPAQGQAPATPPPFMMGVPPTFEQASGYGGTELKGEFDGIPKQDWAAFIGPSVPVYFARMEQQDRRGGKISFTFSAFFFGTFYFAYRKMWGWAAIAFATYLLFSAPSILWVLMDAGIPVFAGFTLDSLATASAVANYLSFARNLLFGVFALYLYRRHAAKQIRSLQQNTPPPGAYQLALQQKGGVSILGIFLVIAVFFAVSFLLYLYAGDTLVNYLYSSVNSPFYGG
ncbi:DUF2628 domain-containing protein [Ruminococcaceae bacterium OttesenSCG-928-I18]|nr:DUF2628 domain-containing protein [Ruminococcaceae bacterium OttesenSCG-928-I18]